MISLEQMRGARGLLNWSQSDLAAQAGISVTAMNNIDRGLSQPRTKTLEHIRKVFENNGIEFVEGNGVRFRKDVFKIETFDGPHGYAAYLEDLLQTQIAKGGEGLHHSFEDANFLKKNRQLHFDFYQRFTKNRLKERILVREGIAERYGPASCSQYRWCSKELFGRIGYSVYGDKYCIFLPNRIVVIENADIADAYRKQFEENWKRGKPLTGGPSQYEQDLKKSDSRQD
jgi:transcriptional regulator with XRE-family HTH domain